MTCHIEGVNLSMENARKTSEHVRGVYVLPRDAQQLERHFMTARQAAGKWGCSRSTAYRLIDEHGPELGRCMISVVRPHKVALLMVIRADAQKPKAHRGNPRFADGRYQSETARAREARRKAHPQA